MLPAVIIIASIGGLLAAGGSMIIRKHSADVPVSFGSWLALAAWVMMIQGDDILKNHLWILNP